MTTISIISSVGSLAIVLLLILLAGRFARTSGLARHGVGLGKRLRVLESLAIDPRRRVVLVQCDNRSVLLLTGAQDQVIGWLPEGAP